MSTTRTRTRTPGGPSTGRTRARLGLVALALAACLAPAAQAATAPAAAPSGVPASAAAAAGEPVWDRSEDGLFPGSVLPSGYAYTASHGSRLVMQTDGNLVLYRAGVALWASGTAGNPGAFAAYQEDGNLVVYRAGASGPVALWASGSSGGTWQPKLVVEDRELSVRYGLGTDGPSGSLWGSSWRSDRLVSTDELGGGDRRTSPSGRCTLVMQTDRNLVEVCDGRAVWSTGVPRSDRPYVELRMQADGNAVVYLLRNSADLQASWSTGTRAAGSSLVVQDDGNVVVVGPDGRPTWSRLTGRLG